MKVLTGKVVSIKQNKTAVVEVTWKMPHPLYKKLLTKSKKFQVDTTGFTPKMEDTVVIIETRPISKNKHFTMKEIKNKI